MNGSSPERFLAAALKRCERAREIEQSGETPASSMELRRLYHVASADDLPKTIEMLEEALEGLEIIATENCKTAPSIHAKGTIVNLMAIAEPFDPRFDCHNCGGKLAECGGCGS